MVLAFTVCFGPPVQVVFVIVRILMRYAALAKNYTHPVLLRYTFFLASHISYLPMNSLTGGYSNTGVDLFDPHKPYAFH